MTQEQKVLFVEWCAADALGGVQNMDPLTELAYRRIIDMIYASDDNLIDDDRVLQYTTKTGAKWKAIKKSLVEVHGKLTIDNGRIRNATCTRKLQKSRKNIDQKRVAQAAMIEKRNALKNKDTGLAAASAAATASDLANQEPNNQRREKEDANASSKKPAQVPRETVSHAEEGFEEFWIGWRPFDMPKGNKKTAHQNYQRARKDTDHETVIAGRDRYLDHCHRTACKTLHASTWLYRRGWEDDYSVPVTPGGTAHRGQKPAYSDTVLDAAQSAIRQLRVSGRGQGGPAAVDGPGTQHRSLLPPAGAPGNHHPAPLPAIDAQADGFQRSEPERLPPGGLRPKAGGDH